MRASRVGLLVSAEAYSSLAALGMTSTVLKVGLPAKICYQAPPFGSTQPRRVLSRAVGKKLPRATPTDSVDEVDFRTFLPDPKVAGDDSNRDSNRDSVLHKRVQALRHQLKPELTESSDTEAASTSEASSDHRDFLARAQHQLQRLHPNRLSPRVRGLVLLNILVLLCGANWVVLKETEDFFDPFTFAALRFTLAAAVFSPWIKNAVQDSTILRGGLELGIWSALAYMTQSVGLVTSDASRASFISTFTVSTFLYGVAVHILWCDGALVIYCKLALPAACCWLLSTTQCRFSCMHATIHA